MMFRFRTMVLASGIGAATVYLGGCSASEAGSQIDPRQADRLVAVATVEPAGAVDPSYTGVVAARVESNLGFRVPGKVVERLVDTGQTVRMGQPLMKIDPTDYLHAVTAQSGDVAAARARWLQTSADERRYSKLVVSGAESQSAYDQAKAAADSAAALLSAAEAREKVARDDQAYAVLVADADGTVVDTPVEPGQVVAAGQVVIRLAHAGPREAAVDLPEGVRPAIGSVAEVTLYGARVPVQARLRQLSDAADPRTRTYEARYVMEGAGAQAPLGATVTLSLSLEQAASTLTVPLGALDDEGAGAGVWTVDPKTRVVSYHAVRVSSLAEEEAEVTGGGIAAGDQVVAMGGHYLHPGQHVRAAQIKGEMQ